MAVDVPPPPIRIENVPPQPNSDCLWADGRWRRSDGQWQWVPGAWVRPLKTCYYAEPLLVWIPSVDGRGVLFHTDGEWYDRSTGTLCQPPVNCPNSVRN
jgi:WXXGXW repeat (2 copies)